MPATASASVEGHPHRRALRNMSKDAKSKPKKTKSGTTLLPKKQPPANMVLTDVEKVFQAEVAITATAIQSLNNDALGERLRMIGSGAKGWKRYEKQLIMLEAARRLEQDPLNYVPDKYEPDPEPYRELSDSEEAAEENTWD